MSSSPLRNDSQDAFQIPDHEMLRCIGNGSYGEVWLARSVVGTFRAIKIISRKRFPGDRPFDREFIGIKKFEPLSRTHAGFVGVLHIGLNRDAGYFYYVMEVADDKDTGQTIDVPTYVPKTLGGELARREQLPVEESARIGLILTDALGHLHRNGLVHRDIKPSNIIFVNGTAKLADIGLVADISESATFVGTEGYVPPEGPGKPTADLFGLGKVLYQISTGQSLDNFPALPDELGHRSDAAQLKKLHQVILKACDLNVRRRFQSAQEMCDQLAAVIDAASSAAGRPKTAVVMPATRSAPLNVAILCQANSEADGRLLRLLSERLAKHSCRVLTHHNTAVTVEWARQLEQNIAQADAAIVLLSPASLESETLMYELEIARDAASQGKGKPRLFPVRIQLQGPIPNQVGKNLDGLASFVWEGNHDDGRLADGLMQALLASDQAAPAAEPPLLEAIGGAVPLDSRYYIPRQADEEFRTAIARGDSIVLVKGARQMGKTSLLARGLEDARQQHCRVAFTDFQAFNSSSLESLEKFYLALSESLASQLDLDVFPQEVWNSQRSPNTNLERYLQREVLEKSPSAIVWGLDEVDRLFTCNFGTEVFGLFRSWHNKRALDPHGPWAKLTLAIAYATEAFLFITDMNQSPFNVGTRLAVQDFAAEELALLNQRYGQPLSAADLERFFSLVGGQPYLVRRALNELTAKNVRLADLEAQVSRDEGIFADHLRRLLISLAKDPELTEVVRGILQDRPCPTQESFYRLRSAGVIVGDSPNQISLRCQLYATYLAKHLLEQA